MNTSYRPQGTKQNRRWLRRWQGERWTGAGCWHTRDTSTLNNARPDPGPGHGPSKMHPNKGDLINLRSVQFIASIRGKSLQTLLSHSRCVLNFYLRIRTKWTRRKSEWQCPSLGGREINEVCFKSKLTVMKIVFRAETGEIERSGIMSCRCVKLQSSCLFSAMLGGIS